MSAIATDVIAEDHFPETVQTDKAKSRFLSGPAGRCGLITYYGGFGRAVLAIIALLLAVAAVASVFGGDAKSSEPPPVFMAIVGGASTLGIIGFGLYYLRLSIRRLHDLNLSAWFVLLYVIPVVGTIFSMYVGLVPGKEIDNRFGPWTAPTRSDRIFAVAGISITIAVLALSGWATLNGHI